MKTHQNETITQWFDRDGGSVFENISFENCTFDNCGLSMTSQLILRATVRNVHLQSCTSFNSHIGPAIFEEVTVDGLKVNDLLIMWGALFQHVTLKGKIGAIKVNLAAHFDDRTEQTQKPFDNARIGYYKKIDWAIDISEAVLSTFELNGVPAKLVRRDLATQAVITRDAALRWRDQMESMSVSTYWKAAIDAFLSSGEKDKVLVARTGDRKNYREDMDGLNRLRDLGILDPG